MAAFGVIHILWLLGLLATTIVFTRLVRRQRIPEQYARYGLALFLALGELQRYLHDGVHWPDRLPLNLCNVTTWAAIYACLTLAPWACEFTYFAGFSGAGMALLTPDMGTDWPPRFFINHGGLILTAATLIFGRIVFLRPRAMWSSYGIFMAYVASIGVFDWIFLTNYFYLRTKPSVSLLSLMGPWPVYYLPAALVGLALYWMLAAVAPRSTAANARVREESESAKVLI